MATATLVTHSGDKTERRVTLEDLLVMPQPPRLGVRHMPIPHGKLVMELVDHVQAKGFSIDKTEWAVAKSGQRLFGVMTMRPAQAASQDLLRFPEEMTMAIGLRHANDMSEALRLVSGFNVFVCSNLAMYGQGDTGSFRKLHTVGLDLGPTIDKALDATFARFVELNGLVERLKTVEVTPDQAKRVIYDVFASKEAPVSSRFFNAVHDWYFVAPAARPEGLPEADDLSDVSQRSLWGISNAFTRAIREQPLGRQIGQSTKVMTALAKVASVN